MENMFIRNESKASSPVAAKNAGGDVLGNTDGFLLASQQNQATVYVDAEHEEISEGEGNEYCGLKIIADTFAKDVELVTGNPANVVTSAPEPCRLWIQRDQPGACHCRLKQTRRHVRFIPHFRTYRRIRLGIYGGRSAGNI